MSLLNGNFTPEDTTITRDMVQAFLDEGRALKAGKPDHDKPSKKTKDDVKAWYKNKGKQDSDAEKLASDLDSYL